MNIGEFSRKGESRGEKAVKSLDHDTNPDKKLVPVGIFEPVSGSSTIIFGNSLETSDLIADSLELWWENNKENHQETEKLVINLDNGPHVQSHRTWFIKRMAEFSDSSGIEIRLVYYPPYHSKYNPVERIWGILENHWNGNLLDSVETALNWAGTMTWNGIHPVIHCLDKIYEKGKKLTKNEMKEYEERIKRAINLPKWDVTISPASG